MPDESPASDADLTISPAREVRSLATTLTVLASREADEGYPDTAELLRIKAERAHHLADRLAAAAQ